MARYSLSQKEISFWLNYNCNNSVNAMQIQGNVSPRSPVISPLILPCLAGHYIKNKQKKTQ
jgi:hypothetical protein